jgi:hypothetical protein
MVLWIFASIAVVACLLQLGVYKGIKTQALNLVAKRYPADQIVLADYLANCFGLQSAGVWQVRGNGGLVLTSECLHFFMLLPNKEFRIPLQEITKMTIAKSHLGKATPFDLLKVTFNNDGTEDSIAWLIKNPRNWISTIDQIRKSKET